MSKYKEVSVMNDPEYREERDKLQDLKTSLSAAEVFADKQHERPSASEQRLHQVSKILAGEKLEDLQNEKTWLESLDKAREAVAILRDAVEVQRRVEAGKHVEASRRLIEPIKPEASARVKARAELFIKLGEQIIDDQEFENSLTNVSQRHLLDFCQIPRLGSPLDWQSLISRWLIEAANKGHINFKLIPQAWREFWYKKSGFKFEDDNTLKSTPVPGGDIDRANYLEKNKDTVANILERSTDSSPVETKEHGEWAVE